MQPLLLLLILLLYILNTLNMRLRHAWNPATPRTMCETKNDFCAHDFHKRGILFITWNLQLIEEKDDVLFALMLGFFYLHHTIAFIWGMPNRWSYIQNSSWNCCCWPPCCSLPKQTRSNLSTPETFSSVCAFDYIFVYWKCAKWLLNYLSTSLRLRFVSLAPAISR